MDRNTARIHTGSLLYCPVCNEKSIIEVSTFVSSNKYNIAPVGCGPIEHCLVMKNGRVMGTLWGENIIYNGNILHCAPRLILTQHIDHPYLISRPRSSGSGIEMVLKQN